MISKYYGSMQENQVERNIIAIRLGASICIWCGAPVDPRGDVFRAVASKDPWPKVVEVSKADLFWLPNAPSKAWVCAIEGDCQQRIRSMSITACLEALDQISAAAKIPRK